MTETTTRRGLRPLLALLFTGMALLMMGAARPAQAATATITDFSLIAGSPGDDSLTWSANATWSGPAGSISGAWDVEITVNYYNGGTVIAQSRHAISEGSSGGGNSTSVTNSATYNGFFYGMTGFDSTIMTGFTWQYSMTYAAVDQDNTSQASDQKQALPIQGYGRTTGDPLGGGGGHDV